MALVDGRTSRTYHRLWRLFHSAQCPVFGLRPHFISLHQPSIRLLSLYRSPGISLRVGHNNFAKRVECALNQTPIPVSRTTHPIRFANGRVRSTLRHRHAFSPTPDVTPKTHACTSTIQVTTGSSSSPLNATITSGGLDKARADILLLPIRTGARQMGIQNLPGSSIPHPPLELCSSALQIC